MKTLKKDLIFNFLSEKISSGEYPPGYRFPTELEFSRQERRWIALSAMRTAIGIGLIYIIGAGLLIWLMLKIWM